MSVACWRQRAVRRGRGYVGARICPATRPPLTEDRRRLNGAGGNALTADAVKRADLTKDGKEDYVLDVSAIDRGGAASTDGDCGKGVVVDCSDSAGFRTDSEFPYDKTRKYFT